MRVYRVFLVLLAVLLPVSACGGYGSSQQSPAYGSGGGYAAESADANYAGAPAPTSPVSTGGYDYGGEGASAEAAPSSAPHPSVRPGLATEWGETRVSRVRSTHFQRASNSPFATIGVQYNDAQGVAHQAAYRSARVGETSYIGAYGDGIRVSVTDEYGRPLPGAIVSGALYIVGEPGQRYVITLTNTTNARFEAVGTVDGLDVITGQAGSFSNRGYILRPNSTLRIEGFRQTSDHVAAFRFGSVGDSYAAQRGNARNVGVMGLAFFAEAGWTPDPAYMHEIELRETANPFPGHYAPPPPRRRYY